MAVDQRGVLGVVVEQFGDLNESGGGKPNFSRSCHRPLWTTKLKALLNSM